MVEPIKPEDDNNNAPQNVVLSAYDTTLNDNHDAVTVVSTARSESSTGTMDGEANPTAYADQSRVLFLVENHQFIVHASKAREFDRIDGMMESSPEEAGMQVIELQESAAKFTMMLQVLHTPVYRATTFDVDTLVSTLTLATKYGHPGLRAYATSVLGPRQHELSPVRRIKVARACNIPEWAPGAIDELSKRPELLGRKEVNELGDDVFKDIARRREQANPGSQPKESVIYTVAMYIGMGFGYLLLSLALLFTAREVGAVAGYLFGVVSGTLGKIAIRVGRMVVYVLIGIWSMFDPAF